MTKHNEAIEHLIRTGDDVGAFRIALQDEGINPNVTFKEWRKFAERCIANRADTKARVASFYRCTPIRTRTITVTVQ